MINRAFLCSVLLVTIVSGSEELRPRPYLNTIFESNSSISDPRIVGGTQIAIADAPYQVSLQFRQKHICGGSIISPKWILTAAHCTELASAPLLRVRVGSARHAVGGTVIPVKRIIEHPNYDSAWFTYDFSLLELQRAILMGKTTMAIALPAQAETVPDGTLCMISGWGSTQNGQEFSATLRSAFVATIKQSDCNSAYAAVYGVSASMICAGLQSGGRDACQGDRGGPLVANGKLIGVNSWGIGCGQPAYPGVYARVSIVRDWIQTSSGA